MKNCPRCGRVINPLHRLCPTCRRKQSEKCATTRAKRLTRPDREPTMKEIDEMIAEQMRPENLPDWWWTCNGREPTWDN